MKRNEKFSKSNPLVINASTLPVNRPLVMEGRPKSNTGLLGIITLVIILSCQIVKGQTANQLDTIRVPAIVVGTDTVPLVNLNEVVITGSRPLKVQQRIADLSLLRSAVYTTYPYAREASAIFLNLNAQLTTIPDQKHKRAYLKAKEAQLRKDFAPKLENLTFYQGKILLKLISRQTGSNCYDIIKGLRGGFSARFWQAAYFIDSNMKTYSNLQQDNNIEIIIREIESGQPNGSYN
jgi:hypothetical protein